MKLLKRLRLPKLPSLEERREEEAAGMSVEARQAHDAWVANHPHKDFLHPNATEGFRAGWEAAEKWWRLPRAYNGERPSSTTGVMHFSDGAYTTFERP